MKIQLEAIKPNPHSSFHLMQNPRLNDFYFWHFHPEYELVYIEGADGRRHVGEHISRYAGSDLVLIGSNIPHLNFDYGIKTDYRKTVLHIRPDFLQQALPATPELVAIHQLLEKSDCGIAFHGATKTTVGAALQQLHGMPPFEQFLAVLKILQQLAASPEFELLHKTPVKNQYNQKSRERLRLLYRFIDTNYHRKIDIAEAAALCHLSEAAFCRAFKQMTRLTFTDFLNHYRVNQAKHHLLQDKNVSETCFACGFESMSYFNRVFKKIVRQNPGSFKKQYFSDK